MNIFCFSTTSTCALMAFLVIPSILVIWALGSCLVLLSLYPSGKHAYFWPNSSVLIVNAVFLHTSLVVCIYVNRTS